MLRVLYKLGIGSEIKRSLDLDGVDRPKAEPGAQRIQRKTIDLVKARQKLAADQAAAQSADAARVEDLHTKLTGEVTDEGFPVERLSQADLEDFESSVELTDDMQAEIDAMGQSETKNRRPVHSLEAYKANRLYISPNMPAVEHARALEVLRNQLKGETEAAYQRMSALQEKLNGIPSGRNNHMEAEMVALQGAADQGVKREFYADHTDPHGTEQHYEGLGDKKRDLLRNPEAVRVLEKLNEARSEGEHITPQMINDLDPTERELGRAWHALERDQKALAEGMEQIRIERAAKENVNNLQIDLIRNLGDELGIPEADIQKFRLPNVGHTDLVTRADQVLADPGKFDVPRNFRERLWSTGLAVAKFFGSESLLGRKRANAAVNKLQLAQDAHKELVEARATKNDGAQLVRSTPNFGASYLPGQGESGSRMSQRAAESEPAISLEESRDLQDALTEARRMTDYLLIFPKHQTAPATAIELANKLQARLDKYKNQPAARSRVYSLAQESLQGLREKIGNATGERAPAVGDGTWEMYDESLGADREEALAEAEVSEQDLNVNFDEELERTIPELEPMGYKAASMHSEDQLESHTIDEELGRTFQGSRTFIDAAEPTLMSGTEKLSDTLPNADTVQEREARLKLKPENYEYRNPEYLVRRAEVITTNLRQLTETLSRGLDNGAPLNGQFLNSVAKRYISDARNLAGVLSKQDLAQDKQARTLAIALARATSAYRATLAENRINNQLDSETMAEGFGPSSERTLPDGTPIDRRLDNSDTLLDLDSDTLVGDSDNTLIDSGRKNDTIQDVPRLNLKQENYEGKSPETLVRRASVISRNLRQLTATLNQGMDQGRPLSGQFLDRVADTYIKDARRLTKVLLKQNLTQNTQTRELAASLASATSAYNATIAENDLSARKEAA